MYMELSQRGAAHPCDLLLSLLFFAVSRARIPKFAGIERVQIRPSGRVESMLGSVGFCHRTSSDCQGALSDVRLATLEPEASIKSPEQVYSCPSVRKLLCRKYKEVPRRLGNQRLHQLLCILDAPRRMPLLGFVSHS